MKLEEIEVEDLDDLSVKQKDRIAAEWLGGVKDRSNTKDIFVECNYLWESEGRTWPRYSEWWSQAGRLLEAFSDFNIISCGSGCDWYLIGVNPMFSAGSRGDGYEYEAKAKTKGLKNAIVAAACQCAIKGIEPRD